MAKKKRKKGVSEAVLDALWSKVVRQRAGLVCEICGKAENLQAHHVYSRNNRAVRWEPENGVCLCAGCHRFGRFSAHLAPLWFSEEVLKRRGSAWSDALLIRAHTVCKPDREEVKQYLLEELE